MRFIGLDTNQSYSPESEQGIWLDSEFKSPEYDAATWHIVYFHHPPYFDSGSDTGGRSELVPLFQTNGVDMVFSGHNHVYERYIFNGINYVVTGGGGAPLSTLGDGDLDGDGIVDWEYGAATYQHCVIDVDVASASLTLSSRYNSGTTFDTVTLYQTAILATPEDNGANDLNRDGGSVLVNTTQSIFDIQLADVNGGINDATVISSVLAVSKGEGSEPLLLDTGPSHYSHPDQPGQPFTLNAGGPFDYCPKDTFHGSDTFTYKGHRWLKRFECRHCHDLGQHSSGGLP